MEAAEEEIQCMEENGFGNVRLATCTGLPKRPTHVASHARPSFVYRFGSDQQGIGRCGWSVEADEEEVLSMEENVFGNVRPATCTGSPKKSAQIADRVGPSDVLRFASDKRGIASYRMFVEAGEEGDLTWEKVFLEMWELQPALDLQGCQHRLQVM